MTMRKSLMFVFLFAFLMISFISAESVSLTSDNPNKEISVNGNVYTISLVSASDTASTIKVTNSEGTSESKEINEGDSAMINKVAVKIVTADETNLKLSATIDVTESVSGDSAMCTDSDNGKDYYSKGVAKSGEWTGEDYCYIPIEGSWTEVLSCSSDDADCSIEEAYCDSQATNNIGRETKSCPNGCSVGACLGQEVESVEELSGDGFKFASWICYDGTDAQGVISEESCVSSESWQENAQEFCKDKCSEETGKCGVNSFSVSGECTLENENVLEEKSKKTTSSSGPGKGEEKSKSAAWVCQDEIHGEDGKITGGTLGQEKSETCRTATEWEEIIAPFCEGKCSEDGECGVEDIDLEDKCESEDEEKDISLICKDSCPSGDSCLPIGYRQKGEFCSGEGVFKTQFESEVQCDNNFECSSNLCIENQCVSGSLIQKILDWFKNVFGTKEG